MYVVCTCFVFAVVVSSDHVEELSSLLVEIASEWDLFLGQLGVTKSARAQIRHDNTGNPSVAKHCLQNGLYHWVCSEEKPMYSKICEVLRGTFVTNKPLAMKVEKFVRDQLHSVAASEQPEQQPVRRRTQSCEALAVGETSKCIIILTVYIVHTLFIPL